MNYKLITVDEEVARELRKRQEDDELTPNQRLRKMLKMSKNWCDSCRRNKCVCDRDTQEAMDKELTN